jgi:hypothetical protein
MSNFFSDKVVDRLIRPIWLFENILWKYSELIAYNTDKELAKKTLAEVYWYRDIYSVIPNQVDEEKFNKFLNQVFSYHEIIPPNSNMKW